MKKIYLHGLLGKKFGEYYEFNVDTPAQAVRALTCAYKQDFINFVIDRDFYVIRGEDLDEPNSYLSENELTMELGNNSLHIVPVIRGSKNSKGFLTLVVGFALIATGVGLGLGGATFGSVSATGVATTEVAALAIGGISITAGQLAFLGAALVFSGLSQLLAPTPKVGDSQAREPIDQRRSFIFNGPINQTEQGGPVPVLYGKVRIGSTVVSGGLAAENIEL